MKMRLYLCGPVSLGGSCTPEQEQANTEKFHDIERRLIGAGYQVESPIKVLEFCKDRLRIYAEASGNAMQLPDDGACSLPGAVGGWQWHMRRTIIQMLTCQGIATLDCVEEPRSCIRELGIANDLSMPIKGYREWLQLAVEVPLPNPLRR